MSRTMRTWQAQGGRSLQDADAFVEVGQPVPEPGAHDLLVRVRAVSVNPVDTKVRAGLAEGATRQLGWDAAGTVEAVGAQVQRFSPGDRVWYAGDLTRPGAHAELHLVDEGLVGQAPSSLDWAESAAMPLTSLTAWEALVEHLGLGTRSEGTLLVIGGAGGVGSVAMQLAKALTGVRVVATASRERSRQWALAMGADEVVDRHDLAESVLAVAPDGVDWVLSPHTAGNIEAYARLVRPFGHVVALDEPEGLDVLPLKSRSIAFHWEFMFTRSMHHTPDMSEQGRILDRVSALVDAERLRSTLTTVVDHLDPAGLREAFGIVDEGGAVGKVVLKG